VEKTKFSKIKAKAQAEGGTPGKVGLFGKTGNWKYYFDRKDLQILTDAFGEEMEILGMLPTEQDLEQAERENPHVKGHRRDSA
jgi:hypothetical protein